ncbi:CorA family divalent cation transporter [Methylopila sp. M107]|uniref:CorA family divalent cation transporter n=1 Tax=Methylopila sp. M107 TaxID=1101190 RepID=UPI0003636CC7|nr:CorA family divalent cation transporter [Methylopila sp. M107]
MDVLGDPRLICGFSASPAGGAQRLEWDGLDAALASTDSYCWIHLDAADLRVQRWIESQPNLPARAKKTLLGEDQLVRFREAGEGGFAGVLSDLHHDFDDDPSAVGALRVYFDEHRVVTARRHPLQAVDRLRRTLEKQAWEKQSCDIRPLNLVANLLLHLSDAFVELVQDATEDLDAVEAAILDDAARGAADLGRVRRLLARLRRHLGPQRLALGRLAARPPEWASQEDANALRDAVGRLDAVGHDLDLSQERARQLQDERAATLAEITNRNLYVLSIVTAVFLPMTLVTGVFGMNVGGLPGVESPHGFLWTVALMAATGLATWAFLKVARIV